MPHRLTRADQLRRLALAELMVEILRPTPGDFGWSTTEKLVGYAVVVSTFGAHPLGLSKLADTTGLPRNTVRHAVNNLIRRGAVERTTTGAFVVTSKFSVDASRMLNIERKLQAVRHLCAQLDQLETCVSNLDTKGLSAPMTPNVQNGSNAGDK